MKFFRIFAPMGIVILLLMGSTVSWAATYQVDKENTIVSFRIRNFMSKTQGFFRDFEGKVDYERGKPDAWSSEGVIKVKSVDTKNAERDHHLLSKDFFDTEKFPTIIFQTTKISNADENGAKINGILEMHGVKKPIILDVQKITLATDNSGVEHLKCISTTRIDRRDFGIIYNAAGPASAVLGNDVMITIQLDAVRQ